MWGPSRMFGIVTGAVPANVRSRNTRASGTSLVTCNVPLVDDTGAGGGTGGDALAGTSRDGDSARDNDDEGDGVDEGALFAGFAVAGAGATTGGVDAAGLASGNG